MDDTIHVYADNAATTRLSRAAWEAMAPIYLESFGNPSSLHAAGQRAKEALVRSREMIARSLGARPRNITFTSGGSEADNQAILTGARLGAAKGHRHIVSTAIEHHAVLRPLEKLREEGFETTLVPPEPNGIVSVEAIGKAVREDTCLVSVMYANNEIGTLQPVSAIASLCHDRGVLFHTDAVQAVGHVPIDFDSEGFDFLSLSAHKFHGPKGIGALVSRRDIPLERLVLGGEQERGQRAGTENVPAIVGMAVALEEDLKQMEESTRHLRLLRDRLIDGLAAIPRSRLSGDRYARLPGNVHFTFEGVEGEALLLYLDDHGVCASSGAACASGALGASHVLLALGRTVEEARGSLRLTLCDENTEEEVDYLISMVAEGVRRLRSLSPVWRKG